MVQLVNFATGSVRRREARISHLATSFSLALFLLTWQGSVQMSSYLGWVRIIWQPSAHCWNSCHVILKPSNFMPVSPAVLPVGHGLTRSAEAANSNPQYISVEYLRFLSPAVLQCLQIPASLTTSRKVFYFIPGWSEAASPNDSEHSLALHLTVIPSLTFIPIARVLLHSGKGHDSLICLYVTEGEHSVSSLTTQRVRFMDWQHRQSSGAC